ncbi:MAG: histidine phosphatase family protein [Lachnospiraceae bacterium]|nr:histidine phosphatase family protein [Lachnospiraceae bacterium]
MLYIMRHGTTDWNALHKLQGKTDIPLNADGRNLAAQAHDKYLDVHFDICYCSPLVRAKETAEILLKDRNIPIFFDDRIKEMGFGIYEGVENSFDIPDCPVNVLFYHPEEYLVPVEGGESLDELFSRTGEFLEEMVLPKVRDGKDVLIVGHGAMNSGIISQIRKYSRADFWKAGIPACELIQLI